MAMVINTNVQAIRTHGVYNYNSSAMNEAMTRVATGQKINSAKDNASTWAITQRMRDRIRANDQANQNVQNDSALLRTAQGGIGNTVSILTTLKERAINAANDSNVNLDRDAIAIEVKQLVQQIDDNASKVKFNGRYLLNGSADPTATTSEAVEESTIVEPKAASMPAATDTTRGSHAVYKLDSWVKANSSNNGTAAVASTDKLNDLLKSGTTAVTDEPDAKTKSAGFKIGDTITFSWKEDGKENSYTYEYTNTADTLAKLEFDKGALKFKWMAANAALNSKDNASIKYNHDGDDGTTAEVASNVVYNSASTPVAVSAGAKAGLYAIGDLGVEITDLKVSVTYADFANNDKETTRVDAQDALLFSGVQQVKEPTADPTYSASAVKLATVQYTSGSSDVAATKDTEIMNLKFGGVAGITGAAYNDYITFKWGTNEADQITVRGNNTLEELQQALTSSNKSASLNFVSAANQELKDADGNYVTQDANGQNYKTEAPAASSIDLYFVSKTGETLDPLQFTVTATDVDGNTKGVAATVKATSVLNVAQEEEVVEEPKELTIAESSPLTFHVGGEADFAIDVTINKMTVDNLFAERNDYGNVTKIYDDSSFSDLFKTKEGATQAISIIDTALNTALAEQTKLGAVEARLGYTSDNLTTMNENLEAANSAFRDSDIAKEMTNYMKYSVLSQAAQYMLAQSGQNSFSVLNLLQQ